MEKKLKNPIIPGYYPDPTICRVGDDYYLACSSFEMSPAIPIFHSKDLANWEQIGNAMTPENGFHVEKNTLVGGVMAPTLRYNDGLFTSSIRISVTKETISLPQKIRRDRGPSRTG